MTKQELGTFLTDQVAAVDAPEFDLIVWRNRINLTLEMIFGQGNRFSKQIKELEYELRMSYEKLYPERVKDIAKSHGHFKATVGNIIEQVVLVDENEFTDKGHAALKQIRKALDNRLTGNQFKELKAAASSQEKLMEIMRTWDPNLSRKILSDILTCEEIWNK